MSINTVCCIGAGFLGAAFSGVLALKCPNIKVHVFDENVEKIEKWNSSDFPVFDRDIEDVVKKCLGKNLFFTSDTVHIKDANIIFVCTEVNWEFTKAAETTEMKALEDATRLILNSADSSKIVVEKSSVGIRGAQMMDKVFKAHQEPYRNFTLISNPEFLTEGCAVNELMNPERVLIGGDNTMRTAKAIETLISLYERWIPRSKIITSDVWSVALSNLAQVAFMAQTLTGINSIAEVGEAMNIDISQVIEAVAMDPRIGVKHLGKSVGFRGLNFVKTIECIIYICKSLHLVEVADYWQKLLDINKYLKQRFAFKIIDTFSNSLKGKLMTILGFSSRTTKDSAVVCVVKALLEKGVKLKVYDPVIPVEVIKKNLTGLLSDSTVVDKISNLVETYSDPYEAVKGSEAIILCTEWPQLGSLDFHKIYDAMVKPPYVFDGNYLLQHKKLQSIGFHVRTAGKNLLPKATPKN